MKIFKIIRENITPRGDGNADTINAPIKLSGLHIRENITPRGDGNNIVHNYQIVQQIS